MSDIEEFLALIEKTKKEALTKAEKDRWDGLKKQLNKIKIGICIAIVSPFVGLIVGTLYLHFLLQFRHTLELFK